MPTWPGYLVCNARMAATTLLVGADFSGDCTCEDVVVDLEHVTVREQLIVDIQLVGARRAYAVGKVSVEFSKP